MDLYSLNKLINMLTYIKGVAEVTDFGYTSDGKSIVVVLDYYMDYEFDLKSDERS